jgi:hypothetical protein
MTTDIAVSHPDKLLYPGDRITKGRRGRDSDGRPPA